MTTGEDTTGTAQRLAYDRLGRGEPLVLLHPLGADRSVWRPVLGALSARREVLNVDLPGFGASPALPGEEPPTPRRLAEAIVTWLLGLDVDPTAAHLAGNSLGGWVALEMAAMGQAASVTAIAPAGLWKGPLAPKREVARRLARVLGPLAGGLMRAPAIRRLALSGSVAHPDRVPPAQAAALVRAYGQAPGFAAVNQAMRAGTFRRLAEIEVPVTLLWPSHDRLIARPRSLPPGIRQRPLPGCGHVPMWDDPAAVAAALLEGSQAGLSRAAGAG